MLRGTWGMLVLTALAGDPYLALAQDPDTCWKQTATRGVGAIPNGCPAGTEKSGLLCYPQCRAGFSGSGPLCTQNCPSGYTDVGLTCGKPGPYGRGSGYPWKFGDSLTTAGAMSRCEGDNGRGNCEINGAMAYPKCRAGFHAVGCCTCSPDCPPGMSDGGALCNKQTYGRTAGQSMTCAGGLVNDAGLCYPACPPGTAGVGPVCWGSCSDPYSVNCGAACATSVAGCAFSIVNQVQSTSEMALNFASMVTTGGSATAGLRASRMAAQATRTTLSAAARSQLRSRAIQALQASRRFEELHGKVERVQGWLDKAGNVESAADMLVNAHEKGEIDLNSLLPDLSNFEALDPTGIVAVYDAFNRPICGDYTPAPPPSVTPLPIAPPPAAPSTLSATAVPSAPPPRAVPPSSATATPYSPSPPPVRGAAPARFELVSARYGANASFSDVSQRLRTMIRNGILDIDIKNEIMGIDPAPGVPKRLEIDYRYGTRSLHNSIAEGGHLSAPNIVNGIVSAVYGAARGQGADVGEVLRRSLREGMLEITVNNDALGGDPAPNRPKVLTVRYLQAGAVREVIIPEGRVLKLPLD